MISLATTRMVLRPWTSEDRADFHALCSDPEVMRYIGDGSVLSREQAEDQVERMTQAWTTNGYGLFALEHLASGQFIGLAGLGSPDFLPEVLPAVEVGWRLSPDFWGQGLATEAAAAVLDWGFGNLDLQRVISVIQTNNQRSHQVANRLGMVRERRTIVPTHKVWADVYELERQQWLQRG